MLDVRRMRVLREVASCGSFSAAAESLNFTQSAISQHVAALERETGTQLVERGRRGVRLTDAGRVLVSHADAILARIDSAEEELAALAGLRGGRLRLISFQSGGATLAPRAVAAFHQHHPHVELSMLEAEPAEATEHLRAGDADLALVYDHVAMPVLAPDLELKHLLDDPYEATPCRPSTRSPSGARSRSTSWPRIPGSRRVTWAAAARSWRCSAARPASSRAWRSRSTRPPRSRRWSRPRSA